MEEERSPRNTEFVTTDFHHFTRAIIEQNTTREIIECFNN